MITVLVVLALIVGMVLLKKNSKTKGCCGRSEAEQVWCDTECKKKD